MNQRGEMQVPLEKPSRNESGRDSEDTVDNSEFSNLIFGSEKATVIDASKPRVSLVGVDCEKSRRRWTVGNFCVTTAFLWSRMSVAKINK